MTHNGLMMLIEYIYEKLSKKRLHSFTITQQLHLTDVVENA